MPIISNILKIRIWGLRAISHLQVQFNWSRVVIPVHRISLMPASSHSVVGWIPGWPTCRPADEKIASADDWKRDEWSEQVAFLAGPGSTDSPLLVLRESPPSEVGRLATVEEAMLWKERWKRQACKSHPFTNWINYSWRAHRWKGSNCSSFKSRAGKMMDKKQRQCLEPGIGMWQRSGHLEPERKWIPYGLLGGHIFYFHCSNPMQLPSALKFADLCFSHHGYAWFMFIPKHQRKRPIRGLGGLGMWLS